jgi:hypothetical protein
MKRVLSVGGLLFLLLGLHWVGQGTGYFPWPRNPVMDNQIVWAYYGAVAAVLGLVIICLPRRKSERPPMKPPT